MLLIFEPPTASSDVDCTEGRLGRIAGRSIEVDDYQLFVRHHRPEMEKNSQSPSHRELLESFAVSLVLAGSMESTSPSPAYPSNLKWKFWELEAGEAYTRVLEEEVLEKDQLDEESLRDYYAAHPEEFTRTAGFSFRNLFLDTTRVSDDAGRTEMANRATQSLQELERVKDADGTVPLDEFQRICKETMGNPSDPIKVRGPFHLNQIKPVLESAALKLEIGQISDILQTENGYYILRLESKTKEGLQPFEEVRNAVSERLSYQRRKERLDAFRKPLLDTDLLKVHEEGLANLVEWASNPNGIENVPFAEVGDFRIGLLDYVEYLRIAGVAPLPKSTESPEEIRESHSLAVRNHILFGAATHQEAIARGYTEDATYRNRIRIGKIAICGKEEFLRLLNERIKEMAPVSEEEIQGYYEQHLEKFMTPPQSRYREIAILPKEATGASQKEFAFREAESMALKWVDSIKSGSPEVETIRSHSQGEEAPEGGLTQWLIPGTRFSPEIWRELEELSPGEWTKTPYRLRGKATLLKLEDRIPSEPLPLESCRGRILKEIAEVRMRLATRKLSHEILEENKFKACEETLNSLAPVQVP